VRLLEAFVSDDESELVLVTELMATDLARFLAAQRRPLSESVIKRLLMMLLDGIGFCHSQVADAVYRTVLMLY
jgi:serine/threonine protein kinase